MITCFGESGGGEFIDARALASVHVTFTGCRDAALDKCASSGAAEGEIDLATLAGTLGVIMTSPEGPAKNVIGLDLQPASGATVAEFQCGGEGYTVTGSVICPLKTNKVQTTLTLAYAQSKGLQKYTHFEAGPSDVLSTKIGAGSLQQTGLGGTIVITPEEKVEADSVF